MNTTIKPAAVLWGDLNMVRCFAGHRAPRFVLTSDPKDPTRWSRHCRQCVSVPDPRKDPNGALTWLERVAVSLSPKPVLFYGTDAQLLLISRNRERLSSHYRFLIPEHSLLEKLVDKCQFAQIARESGIATPRTITSDEYSANPGTSRIPLPCIIKPNRHIGWSTGTAVQKEGGRPRKGLLAETKEQFARAIELLEEFGSGYVIQEYVPGGDNAIYSYHAFSDDAARPLGQYVGRKIRTYPKRSGISTCIELVDDPAVLQVGREVVRKLGLVGVVKLDFKRNPETGELFLLEVNPRFNLWNRLGAVSGVNLPRLAYDYLTRTSGAAGVALPKDVDIVSLAKARTGTRWLSFADDLRAFLREYHADGDLSWLDWLRSVSRANVYDVFAWDDPTPFFVNVAQEIAMRLRMLRRRAA